MLAAISVYTPVEASSTYEETVLRLGTAIRVGVLGSGERLPPERLLAGQLGISRSTLRQALAHLTATGHLVAYRGRTGGTFVTATPPVASGASVDPAACRALMDWRMTLELGAVQLAAERATNAQREAVTAAAGVDPAETWAAFRRGDAGFHLLLAQVADSPRMVEAMTRVQGELSDVLIHLGLDVLDPRVALRQHRVIAEAVAGADPAGAREAMRDHLVTTERQIEAALSDRRVSG